MKQFRLNEHLSAREAALASSGDLPVVGRLLTRAHCILCVECAANVAAYKEDHARVRAIVPDFELPRAMNWNALEREMFANIRLGADINEIGESYESVQASPHLSWRAAIAIGAMVATVMTGWFLAGPRGNSYMQMNQPPAPIAQVRSGSMLLKGDQGGVGVESRGSGFILRGPASQPSRVEVSLEGSVRRSSVDNESGQITVSQIYVD